jgi:hypothetical protein
MSVDNGTGEDGEGDSAVHGLVLVRTGASKS